MNKFCLLLLIIVSVLSFVNCQRVLYYDRDNSNNIRNTKPYNGKVFFPGKTNEAEVNSKRHNSAISNGFVRESNLNQNQGFRGRPSANVLNTNSNANSNNRRNSGIIKNSSSVESSEESKERRTSTSTNRRTPTKNSHRDTGRVQSPAVVSTTIVTTVTSGSGTTSTSTTTTSVVAASPLRVGEMKYAEYIQRIFPQDADTASDANDSEFNGRILAAPGEYPHMAALGFRAKNGNVDYKCGGSLISEHFVITAAHCTNFTGLHPSKVRIGDLNLMVEENYLEPQIRDIKRIYVHPEYVTKSYYNDIALLELEDDVDFTEFVRPIRLWTRPNIPFTTAYAMGYGATDFAKRRTNRLTNLNMTIVPNDECNREMPKLPETERGIISSQICARDYELNRDTCQGDSGGPLQLNIFGRRRRNRLHYQLIGITSYGLYCRSGYPSIFTRVYSYLDWIEHIVWREYFD